MNLICINCPKGCELNAEVVEDKINVTGNSCPKGIEYAQNELLHPMRFLTTTIPIQSNFYDCLPVITSAPIPANKLISVMKKLKDVKVEAPIKMNQVIVENILDLGVDIIASKTIRK